MNRLLAIAFLLFICTLAGASDANRFTYLDNNDPFYPDRHFPKLTTPQWVGESNVEAVVVLAIDDMRDTKQYETFLRPILNRLKKIDGRAPVSIMTCEVKPKDPPLQTWLKEGLSIEVHTLAHPCPLLAKKNFAAAQKTVYGCIDLLNKIPGNKPVAFRMPCCDSMNSASPRFYAEIFNRPTATTNFLTIDSSVMNITTSNDKSLPSSFTRDADGKEKFRKYIPSKEFAISVEDYPYPYVIGSECWEFPGAVPSDWEAQNLHGTNNPQTVADWEALLDATVIKQGVFNFIFHPHGWIKNTQIVEFIDYAQKKYGNKVKFLNFREALERVNRNVLVGHPLRSSNGQKNGIRILDLNNDGYMDAIIADDNFSVTRLWNNVERKWTETTFPVPIISKAEQGNSRDNAVRFGVIQSNGLPSIIVRTERLAGAWDFNGNSWVKNDALMHGLNANSNLIYTTYDGCGRGVRLRDIDKSGRCSLIVGNDKQNAVLSWSMNENKWVQRAFSLPAGTAIADATGHDMGLRFVDLDGDGYDDIVFSNDESVKIYTFFPKKDPLGFDVGWTREIVSASRKESQKKGDLVSLPPITRNGRNNGVWFKYGRMWIQNEFTQVRTAKSGLHEVANSIPYKTLIKLGQPKPKTPQQSLACIQTVPGFKVELVAHEPLTKSPVAFEWGADGKLWVVEMGDYPLGLDGKGKPGGIVRFLEDTNGDGIYDKSTVFLSGVNFPNGIYPWGKGVIISAAPEIFYAEDTDGDGKADVHKTLFKGFREGNQQHRANGFDYGLDGWLYGANGDSGGEIACIASLGGTRSTSPQPVSISGSDFCFNPNTGEFQTQAGQTQFGRHRDDWGNWFGNNNATMLWHYFLPTEYLGRNPHLSARKTYELLAQYPEGTRVFPTSKTLQRFNDPGGANHLTSGNSPTPYRDSLFGPEFMTSVFISEPVHNLIHREDLERDGVTFKSHRGWGEWRREFLSSSDNWFRPTQMKTGPDGALYIADMYRLVIEHPEWIPSEIQKQYDLRAGADKGRIYRVYPAKEELEKIPNLATKTTAQLCATLDSADGWQRDTAQRLLIERHDLTALKLLEQDFLRTQQSELWSPFSASGNSQNPRISPVKGRIHILYTLRALSALTPELLTKAIQDPNPSVREHAVHLCESFLTELPVNAELATNLLKAVTDPDVRVRYQLAFVLGSWNDPRAGKALATIAMKKPVNEAIQIAVMSSATNHVGEMLAAVWAAPNRPPKLVEQLLGLATSMNDTKAYRQALSKIGQLTKGNVQPWQLSALAGFLDALDRQNMTLKSLHDQAPADLKKTIEKLHPVMNFARATASNPNAPKATRITSIRLLGRGQSNEEADIKKLGAFLTDLSAPDLQKAALENLKQSRSAAATEVMLAGWKTYLPATRTEILTALLSRPEWTKQLLDALENGSVPPGQIPTTFQQKLLTSATFGDRAKKIFASANPDRKKLVADYQVVSSLQGDANRGAALFKQNCTTCHFFKGEGNTVGPDLGALANKSVQTLLVAILDPNQAIESRYIAYTGVTKDERELTGVISAETPTSITLKGPGGTEEVILRTDLASLTNSGLSLMPEGLEKALDHQGMADLIAYLNSK